MSNTVFLNGKMLAEEQAQISPLDRGFMFGDGVYEVIPVYFGSPFCLYDHLVRLQHSCDGIRLQNPYSDKEWTNIINDLIQANAEVGKHQSLYVQVTRGAPSSRDHLFPENVSPTVFIQTKAFPEPDARLLTEGASLISQQEIRWDWCHLKTISLVANVLLKQLAYDAGADEVLLIRDGLVQECSASNVFIVSDGVVKTPLKSQHLLSGITRDFILKIMRENEVECIEENITEAEISQCDEIWISSSTKELIPVTSLNKKIVGNGKPGQLWAKVYQLFQVNKI